MPPPYMGDEVVVCRRRRIKGWTGWFIRFEKLTKVIGRTAWIGRRQFTLRRDGRWQIKGRQDKYAPLFRIDP